MKLNNKQFFLLLGWGILSFVLMGISSEYNFLIGVFGQFFFGLCLLCYRNSKDKDLKLFIIPFMILGIIFVILSILSYLIEFNLFNACILMFFGSILITGVGLIVFPIKTYYHLLRVCTYDVSAPIIRYDRIRRGKHKFYHPVYSFRYNDKDCEIVSNIGYDNKPKEIGYVEIMKVNPNNLDEYYIERPTKYLLMPIMGIIFIIFSGINMLDIILKMLKI